MSLLEDIDRLLDAAAESGALKVPSRLDEQTRFLFRYAMNYEGVCPLTGRVVRYVLSVPPRPKAPAQTSVLVMDRRTRRQLVGEVLAHGCLSLPGDSFGKQAAEYCGVPIKLDEEAAGRVFLVSLKPMAESSMAKVIVHPGSCGCAQCAQAALEDQLRDELLRRTAAAHPQRMALLQSTDPQSGVDAETTWRSRSYDEYLIHQGVSGTTCSYTTMCSTSYLGIRTTSMQSWPCAADWLEAYSRSRPGNSMSQDVYEVIQRLLPRDDEMPPPLAVPGSIRRRIQAVVAPRHSQVGNGPAERKLAVRPQDRLWQGQTRPGFWRRPGLHPGYAHTLAISREQCSCRHCELSTVKVSALMLAGG